MKRISFFLICTSFLSAQTVSTGLSFLTLGIGARSIAMGEAYTAVTSEHASVFYNPASMAFASRNEIVLMHKNWIAETNSEYLGSTILGKDLNFGLSILSSSVNDIEIRTIPGDPVGTFNARNIAIGGSVSYRATGYLSVGISGKMLYEKIFTDEATGYGIDAGMLYRFDDGINVGASILNIGSMSALRNDKTILPATMRLGVSYQTVQSGQFGLIGTFDAVKTFRDPDMHLHAGMEAGYQDLAFIRIGYQTGYEFKSFSAGAGVKYRSVIFDYAFVPFSGAFTSTHTFSLSFLL